MTSKIATLILVSMLMVGGGSVVLNLNQRSTSYEVSSRADAKIGKTPYYDISGKVIGVIDGDTIKIEVIGMDRQIKGVRIGGRETVRMGGGIDAPDFGDNGYDKAKNIVVGLATPGSVVYLDLDDFAESKSGLPYRDLTPSERLVAAIYAVVDNRWVNVNAEILRWGKKFYPSFDWLKYRNIPSEFDPHKWLQRDYPYVSS